MNHSEMTKHIRGRIRFAGIEARVRKAPASSNCIQVISPAFDKPFTQEQAKQISFIAKCNHLTLVRGMEIELENKGFNNNQLNFYMP